MADPKIKYDIEAAVKGAADADDLAKAMRNVGDVLEGDLKQGAADAAAALDALGSKQRALRGFSWVIAALGVIGLGTVFTAALFPLTELAMILTWVWMAILGARLPRRINR